MCFVEPVPPRYRSIHPPCVGRAFARFVSFVSFVAPVCEFDPVSARGDRSPSSSEDDHTQKANEQHATIRRARRASRRRQTRRREPAQPTNDRRARTPEEGTTNDEPPSARAAAAADRRAGSSTERRSLPRRCGALLCRLACRASSRLLFIAHGRTRLLSSLRRSLDGGLSPESPRCARADYALTCAQH
jgi:hypothetical protein